MKVIVYDSIEKKNLADNQEPIKTSSKDALIKTLDLMDFYSKFSSSRNQVNDNIPWIILKMKKAC